MSDIVERLKYAAAHGIFRAVDHDMDVSYTEAAETILALRARVETLTEAVERAQRHAQNIGITDGSYIAQLDAALATEAE